MTSLVAPGILSLWAALDLIGVILNGVIGGSMARQRNFDFVGFFFLALFSALGGGMVRDVLLQHGPPIAITDPIYILMAFAGALIALVMRLEGRWWDMFRVHADAIILGVWAVTGATKALALSLPMGSAVFLGLITAVGGGMIRDIASGGPPTVFGGQPLYAVPAVVAATLLVIFDRIGYLGLGMIVAGGTGAALAIFAFWMGWVLPQHSYVTPRSVWMCTRRLANLKRTSGSIPNEPSEHGSFTG